jgi:hypothetical protein
MAAPKGTTPTLTLTFPENTVDLTTASNVYVTFAWSTKTLTKTGSDLAVSPHSIDVYLTQAETLRFPVGAVKVQANWVFSDGSREASNISSYDFTANLLEKVLP